MIWSGLTINDTFKYKEVRRGLEEAKWFFSDWLEIKQSGKEYSVNQSDQDYFEVTGAETLD